MCARALSYDQYQHEAHAESDRAFAAVQDKLLGGFDARSKELVIETCASPPAAACAG